MVYLMRAVNEKKTELNQQMAEFAYTCAGCNICDRCYILSIFDQEVKPSDHIRLLRAELVRKDVLPEKVKKLRVRMETEKSGAAAKLTTPAPSPTPETDVVIVADRAMDGSPGAVAPAVSSLLRKMGKKSVVFSEDGYCGSTLYDFGFWEELGPQVKATWEKLQPVKQKPLVFTNPHCQEFAVNRFPEYAPDYTPIKTEHLSQTVVDALKSGVLQSKAGGKKLKVAYHDPCYLGRGLGIYDAPREVLGALDGVELVEMERNRKASFCCGARAWGNFYPEDTADSTAKERIEEFRATGADILVTACNSCKINFTRALPKEDKGRVKDLFELADERL
jgi:Fe-S oxidoreductase